MALRLQRLFLLLGALGWAASLVFVCAPAKFSADLLQSFGLRSPLEDPLLHYWLRMSGGVFFMIGVLFALPLWQREKHKVLIPLLGIFSIVEAIILCLAGFSLDIPAPAFAIDSLFCLFVGAGILCTQRKLNNQLHNQP